MKLSEKKPAQIEKAEVLAWAWQLMEEQAQWSMNLPPFCACADIDAPLSGFFHLYYLADPNSFSVFSDKIEYLGREYALPAWAIRFQALFQASDIAQMPSNAAFLTFLQEC
ncbi:MAG TPA: hypothetical protein VNV63_06750 [Nitrospiria bacterium]|nr:hypothetical protein [Nitrospiria bacterium]